jgi:endonuclease YncB( thermonuclease family)
MIAALLCVIAVPIHDGDGVIHCTNGDRLRLAGIQAPDYEFASPCREHRPGYVCDSRLATAARDNLRRLAPVGSTITYRIVDSSQCRRGFQEYDPYKRHVVVAWNGAGVELGQAQLAGGFAVRWSCKR